MHSYSIRAANFADLPQLNQMMYQLHEHHNLASPDLFKTPEEVEEEKSIASYLDNPECFVYVAQDESDHCIGFVSGHFCELISPIVKSMIMGSIDEIYIDVEHRNNGVAQMLFDRLESSLKECGVQQIFVEVWQFNQTAVNFYNKSGFEHHIHWMRKSIT